MKMKSNVILNDDKVIKERLKYCVHITLGRFLNIQRTVSPLSHEKVAGQRRTAQARRRQYPHHRQDREPGGR